MDKVTYRYSWVYHAAFTHAFSGVEKGFWAEEGIDVTLKPGAGIPNTQLIGNGVELFANEGYGDVIEAVQVGMPVKAVFGTTQLSPMSVLSPADKPIRNPKDLEGKTIVGGAGSATFITLEAVMKAAGADYSKVEALIVDWGAINEMLMLGKADGATLYWPIQGEELKAEGFPVYALKYSDYGVNIIGEGIIASDELIAENPDLVRRFIRADKKSWDWAAEHVDEATDIFIKYNPDLDWGAQKQAFLNLLTMHHTENTEGKPLGWMAKEDWESSQDIMTEYLGLEKMLPVESYYTNEFVP